MLLECHTIGMLWKEREFLTTAGKEVANGKEIRKLLEAIHLPEQISVIHCATQRNALANATAKAAARQQVLLFMLVTPNLEGLNLPGITEFSKEA